MKATKYFLYGIFVLILACNALQLKAQDAEKDFGAALRIAQTIKNQKARDEALTELAYAELRHKFFDLAKQTVSQIKDEGIRSDVWDKICMKRGVWGTNRDEAARDMSMITDGGQHSCYRGLASSFESTGGANAPRVIAESVPNDTDKDNALSELGRQYASHGEFHKAAAIAGSITDPWLRDSIYKSIANEKANMGLFAEAKSIASSIIDEGLPGDRAETFYNIATAALKSSHPEEIQSLLEEMNPYHRTLITAEMNAANGDIGENTWSEIQRLAETWATSHDFIEEYDKIYAAIAEEATEKGNYAVAAAAADRMMNETKRGYELRNVAESAMDNGDLDVAELIAPHVDADYVDVIYNNTAVRYNNKGDYEHAEKLIAKIKDASMHISMEIHLAFAQKDSRKLKTIVDSLDPTQFALQAFDAYLDLSILEEDRDKSLFYIGRARMLLDPPFFRNVKENLCMLYGQIATREANLGLLAEAIQTVEKSPNECKNSNLVYLIKNQAEAGRFDTAKQLTHLVDRSPADHVEAWQDIAEAEAKTAEKRAEELKKELAQK